MEAGTNLHTYGSTYTRWGKGAYSSHFKAQINYFRVKYVILKFKDEFQRIKLVCAFLVTEYDMVFLSGIYFPYS